MGSNSNFNITKVVVDPTSQEITNLEINGKAFESGGSSNLEYVTFDEYNPLNVAYLFDEKAIAVQIDPSIGYDGIRQVNIEPGGLTGCPALPQTLQSTSTISCDENGNVAPDTEASDAIVSYDTESILPLITNIWIGSSSFSKLDIIDYRLVGSGDYYVYQVSNSGDYPYIKEVD